MSSVYFLQAGRDGPIKIGFTAGDPRRRMKNLQSGCPVRPTLLGAIPGGRPEELALQTQVLAHRTHGDWFQPHPSVLRLVDRHMTDPAAWRPPAAERRSGLEPATSVVRKLGGPSTLSRLLGIHRTRVSNWMRPRDAGGTGGLIPQRYYPLLLRLARDRELPLKAEDFLPVANVEPSSEPEHAA